MPRRRKILSQSKAAVSRRNLKKTNFSKYRASSLRSSWLNRAKKLGVDVSTVPIIPQIEKWLNDQIPFTCHYTKEPLGLVFEADHLVPISRGGVFSLSNIVLTRPLLNGAKGNLTDTEFRQLLKLISKWPDKGNSLLQRLRRGHF